VKHVFYGNDWGSGFPPRPELPSLKIVAMSHRIKWKVLLIEPLTSRVRPVCPGEMAGDRRAILFARCANRRTICAKGLSAPAWGPDRIIDFDVVLGWMFSRSWNGAGPGLNVFRLLAGPERPQLPIIVAGDSRCMRRCAPGSGARPEAPRLFG